MFVCQFAGDHISRGLPGSADPNFTNFFVHVTCGCDSVLLWWCSDTLGTSGFMDHVVLARAICDHTVLPATRQR